MTGPSIRNPDCFIDYLEFPSCDLKATRTFFENLLGWEFQEYGPDYIDFKSGSITGGFFKSEHSAAQDNGSVLVVLKHHDLGKLQNDVIELGGKISKEIFSFPGGCRFHFTEPAGNELAAWCPDD